MSTDEIQITKDSEQVIYIIRRLHHCKFLEIQPLCELEENRLYKALIYLIQQNLIKQEWRQNGIFYCMTTELDKEETNSLLVHESKSY